MRILVTGVTGQVGSELLKVLPGYELIAADRDLLNLAEPDRFDRVLDTLRPDLLINCAAYTAVDMAEEERDLASLVNSTAPAALSIWAAKNGKALIHFSTDYVFDGSGQTAWTEASKPNPLSWYGTTKLAGERAVLSSGANALVIRTSWVYAATGRNFLLTIARLATEKEELRVVSDQVGAPTSAALIANSCREMISGGLSSLRANFSEAGGLIHLTASGATTWHGFASAIVQGLAARGAPVVTKAVVPVSSEEYPALARRPKNSRLSLERLQEIFGITPSAWEHYLAQELDKLVKAPGSAEH